MAFIVAELSIELIEKLRPLGDCGRDRGRDRDRDRGRDRGGASVAGLVIVPACSAPSRPLRAGCAGARGDARSLDCACARRVGGCGPALVRARRSERYGIHCC
jgi:hypothetical protein